MATIEIEVGELHANLHEQLEGAIGEQYQEKTRNEMEELIHDTYRQLERAQEQQSGIEQKDVLDDGDE